MKENLFTPDCIRTFTGKYVNVFDPKPEMFCIEDIAHSLSMKPRWGGHTKSPISVAQHSIEVMTIVSEPNKFTAFMHDVTEAYLPDVPSPQKKNMPEFLKLEHELNIFLSGLFGYVYPFPAEIHFQDKAQLKYEWEKYMLQECFNDPLQTYYESLFLKMFKTYNP